MAKKAFTMKGGSDRLMVATEGTSLTPAEARAAEEVCRSCDHWTLSECHRHAPRPVQLGEAQMLQTAQARSVAWPVTAASDTCGEWEKTR
jgi:hypothetical protein